MLTWDETLLVWLNHAVSVNSTTFFTVMFLADRVPMVLSVLVMIALWFTGETVADTPRQRLTLRQSRQQVILIQLSMVIAFILGRVLSTLAFRPLPLVDFPLQVPINPEIWAGVVTALGTSSAFPSDHAPFWFALVAGLFMYSWRAGLAAGLLAIFFSALRVGLGYHYPTDMLAGASLGVLTLAGVYAARRQLNWFTYPLAQFFEKTPVWAYPLGALIMIDITQQMAWLFGLLTTLLGLGGPQ